MNARDIAVDTLTTHRHGVDKAACDYCARYYRNLWDQLVPVFTRLAQDDDFARRVAHSIHKGTPWDARIYLQGLANVLEQETS